MDREGSSSREDTRKVRRQLVYTQDLRQVLDTSLTAEDLTDSDYGLVVVSEGGSMRVVKPAAHREPCREDEIQMLVSALRRVKAREFLVIVPAVPETPKIRPLFRGARKKCPILSDLAM